MRYEKMILHLAKTNEPDYNYLKLAEELAELQEVVLKYLTKKGTEKQPQREKLVEEMAHVKMRIDVLTEMLNVPAAVAFEIEKKTEKYSEYVALEKYAGKI